MRLKDEEEVHNPNINMKHVSPNWEEYSGKTKCDTCEKKPAKYKRRFKFTTRVELFKCETCHNPKKHKPDLGIK